MYERIRFEALPTENDTNPGTNGYKVFVNDEVVIEQTFSTDINSRKL